MQNIGANGKTYEENWARHQMLLDNVKVLAGELNKQIAARDSASQQVEEQRGSAAPEEMKRLEEQLSYCDVRVEEQREKYVAAQTEVGRLELQVGPEQAAWLSEGLAPAKLDPQVEKTVEDAPTILGAAKNLNEMVRGGEQLAELAHGADAAATAIDAGKLAAIALAFQAQSHCAPGLDAHEMKTYDSVVAQQMQPVGTIHEQNSKDLLEGVQRDQPSRRDREEERDNIDKANAYEKAPSNERPREEVEALDKVHLKERQDLKKEFEKEQDILDERDKRQPRDPMLVELRQIRVNEDREARMEALVEKQAEERKDLLQNGPRDRTKVLEGKEDFF